MLVYDQITFCFLAKGLVGNACRCSCCVGNGISIHAKNVFVDEKRSQSAAGERAHRSGTVLFDHVRAYTSQLFFFFVRRPIAVEDIYGDDASVASRTTLGLPGNDRLIVGTAAGAPTLGLSPQPFLPPHRDLRLLAASWARFRPLRTNGGDSKVLARGSLSGSLSPLVLSSSVSPRSE